MAFLKIAIFATLATVIYAEPQYGHVGYAHAPAVGYAHAPVVSYAHAPVAVAHAPVQVEQYAPPHYEFKYGVNDQHTHDIKEQAEKREGDRVEGYYSLLEPDGTTRTVHYTADHHNGFNAHVERSGHAAHPAAPVKVAVPVQKVVAAPVYAHAAPVLSYGSGGHGYGSLGSYH